MTALEQMERRATLLKAPQSNDLYIPEGLDELMLAESRNWKPRQAAIKDPQAFDGGFYRDMRTPFITADQSPVTLSTTDKALYTPSIHPVLGGQYWWLGKKVKISAFGKITTAATPGNGTFALYWGTGADANGTIIVSSGAQTLIASQTNISWGVEYWIHCRSTGSAGTLFARGRATFGTAVIAIGSFPIPASAAVVSGSLDLTAPAILSIQFKRSGSTAETMTVQDFEYEAMN